MSATASTATATASVLWYMMVHVLVNGNVYRVGLSNMHRVMLFDFDLVGLLNRYRHQLFYCNRDLLLDLLGNQLVDGHGDGLGHRDVHRVGLGNGDLDDLGHRDPHGMRHGHADFLHHFHGHWLGVLDGLGRNVVVLGAAVLGGGVEGFPATSAAEVVAAAEVLTAAEVVAALTAAAAADFAAGEPGLRRGQGQGQHDGGALKIQTKY